MDKPTHTHTLSLPDPDLPVRVRIYPALPTLPERREGDFLRYANRRLYDRVIGDYVTMEEVREYISHGKSVRILDRVTLEDVTTQVLAQCLTEVILKRPDVVSADTLRELIQRFYPTGSPVP